MPPIDHQGMIIEHVAELKSLREGANQRGERLKSVESQVQIISAEMGIKIRDNGERDRELARLQKRIDCFETDDKTLAEKVNELRTNQARILGLLENKDKSLSRRDKYIIFIFGSIVTVCGIVAGIVL